MGLISGSKNTSIFRPEIYTKLRIHETCIFNKCIIFKYRNLYSITIRNKRDLNSQEWTLRERERFEEISIGKNKGIQG